MDSWGNSQNAEYLELMCVYVFVYWKIQRHWKFYFPRKCVNTVVQFFKTAVLLEYPDRPIDTDQPMV